MRVHRLLTSVTLATAAITCLGAVHVDSAQDSLTFRATVSGKAHDAGAFSRSEAGTTMGTLIGCGVVKHRSAKPYGQYNVGGAFAINGHAYAGHPTSTSAEKVTLSPDGRSGTWTDPDALRNYPAKVMKPVPGFAFQATWHCSTVYPFHD